MTQDPPYRQKVYNALKGELGDSFNKSFEEFNSTLDSDPEYKKKVYTALKSELGNSFNKTEDEFYSSVKIETAEVSPNVKQVGATTPPLTDSEKPTTPQSSTSSTSEASGQVPYSLDYKPTPTLVKSDTPYKVTPTSTGERIQSFAPPKPTKAQLNTVQQKQKDLKKELAVDLTGFHRDVQVMKEDGLITEDENGEIVPLNQEAADEYNRLVAYTKDNNLVKAKQVEELQKQEVGIKSQLGSYGGFLQNEATNAYTQYMKGISNFTLRAVAAMTGEEISGDEVTKITEDMFAPFREKLSTSEITKEYVDNIPFIPKALGGAAAQIPTMITPYAAGIFFQSYATAADEVVDMDLTPAEKETYKVAGATIEAALERVALKGVLKNNPTLKKFVVGDFMSKVAKEGATKPLEEIANESIQQVATRYGKDILKGGAGEGVTGALQEASNIALKEGINQITEGEGFKTDTMLEYTKQVLEAGAAEAVGGIGLSTAFGSIAAFRDGKLALANTDDIKTAQMVATQDGMSDFNKAVNDAVEAESLSAEEADSIKESAVKFAQAVVSIPQDYRDDPKTIELVAEKQDLVERNKTLDPAFQEKNKARIEEIDNELLLIQGIKPKDGETTKETQEGAVRDTEQENIKTPETTEDATTVEDIQNTDGGLVVEETFLKDNPIPTEQFVNSVQDVNKVLEQTDKTETEAVYEGLKSVERSDWFQTQTPAKQQEIKDWYINNSEGIVNSGKLSAKQKAAQKEFINISKNEAGDSKFAINRKQFINELNKQAKFDVKQQKNIAQQVKDFFKPYEQTGQVSAVQASRLAKKAANLNFSKPNKVLEFFEYADKVLNDAAYDEKLQEAEKLRSDIRKVKKQALASDKVLADKFLEIDPLAVDVDLYVEKAMDIYDGLRKVKKKGETKDLPSTINYESASGYIKEAVEMTRAAQQDRLQEAYNYLPEGLTLEDINEVLDITEATEESTPEQTERINKILSAVKAYYDEEIGDRIKTDTERKADLQDILDLDITKVPKTKLSTIFKVLGNVVVNNDYSNFGEVREQAFLQRAEKLNKQDKLSGKQSPLKKIGGVYQNQFATLDQITKTSFRGIGKSVDFARNSGIADFKNGVVKSVKEIQAAMDGYNNLVKSMKDHNTIDNVTERFVYAFMSRNDGTSPTEIAEEFNRRKSVIEDQIEYMKSSNDERTMSDGKVLEEKFNSVVGDAKTPAELKASENNKKIVEFFVKEFDKVFPELYKVSKEVYNKILPKDRKYTPDVYKLVNRDGLEEIGEETFFNDVIDAKESSVIKEVVKPKRLPRDPNGNVTRALSTNFDGDMIRKLDSAIMEANTAQEAKNLRAFFDSKESDRVMDAPTKKLIKDRVRAYVNMARGRMKPEKGQVAEIDAILDTVSKIASIKALASLDQPIMQTIPVAIRTTLNLITDPRSIQTFLNYFTGRSSEDLKKLANYGEVSVRGLKSVVDYVPIERINTSRNVAQQYSERLKKSKLGQAVKAASDAPLKFAVEKPDVHIAKSAWVGYYHQYINRQGLEFNAKKEAENPHKDAIEFANQMVSNTQNASVSETMGKAFSTKNSAAKFLRSVMMPFANFQQNLRTDMYSNAIISFSKYATKKDQWDATKGFATALAEMAAFNFLKLGIRYYLMGAIASAVFGFDEEDWDELWKRWKKTFNTNVISDIAPLPLTDKLLLYFTETMNKVIRGEDYDEKENAMVYKPRKMSDAFGMGKYEVVTDLADKLRTAIDMGDIVKDEDGDYTIDKGYGDQDKNVDTELRDEAELAAWMVILWALVPPVPNEVGRLGNEALRKIDKGVTSKSGGETSSGAVEVVPVEVIPVEN